METIVLVEKIFISVRPNMQCCYEKIDMIMECANLQVEENNYFGPLLY